MTEPARWHPGSHGSPEPTKIVSQDLDIEVVGEAPEIAGRHRHQQAPTWGMPVAIALVGVLVLGTLVVVASASLRHHDAVTAVPTVAPPTSGTDDDIVAAALSALQAWGRFAGSGDLAELRSLFDVDGPQYRELAAEAPALEAAPSLAYAVDTQASVKERTANRAVIDAVVVWRRPGEADQRLHWTIELRTADQAWRLWTVTGNPDQTSPDVGEHASAANYRCVLAPPRCWIRAPTNRRSVLLSVGGELHYRAPFWGGSRRRVEAAAAVRALRRSR